MTNFCRKRIQLNGHRIGQTERDTKTFQLYGEDGFFEEHRGKGNTGRLSTKATKATKDLSAEKKLEKAEAHIKYLEAENELLKKLEALERQAKKRADPSGEIRSDQHGGAQISIEESNGAPFVEHPT